MDGEIYGEALKARKVNTKRKHTEKTKESAFRQVICPVTSSPTFSSFENNSCSPYSSFSLLASDSSVLKSFQQNKCHTKNSRLREESNQVQKQDKQLQKKRKKNAKEKRESLEESSNNNNDRTTPLSENFPAEEEDNKKFLAKKIRLLKSQNPEFGIKRIWDQLREVYPTLKFSKVKNRVKNLGLVIQSPGLRSQPARFQCGVCAKSYTRKNGLVRHQRTHTGVTPFECTECGKSFGLKTSLLEHMRVHSGEKPFKCLTCARAFKNRSGWRRHVSTHSLEKKFECPIEGCGQKFCRQFSLTQHLGSLQHNGTEIYVCSLCYKVLSSSMKLKHHMWVHRPRTKQSPSTMLSSVLSSSATTLSSSASTSTASTTTSSLISSSATFSSYSNRRFSSSRIRFSSLSPSNSIFSSVFPSILPHTSCVNPSPFFTFQLFDEDDFCLEDEEFNSRENDGDNDDDDDADYSLTTYNSCSSPSAAASASLLSDSCTTPDEEAMTPPASFACEIEGCGKTFAYRHVLRKHLLSHSMEADFACPQCVRSFKSQAALDYHEQYQHEISQGEIERREERGSKHTLRFLICGGGSMWKCSLCQEAFKRKFDLQCHYVSCHSSLPTTVPNSSSALTTNTSSASHDVSVDFPLTSAQTCQKAWNSCLSSNFVHEEQETFDSYGYGPWGAISAI